MRSPKVSVIIPIYNVELYLRECLDSVVNQTLKDIEIICVDDGSPDHSAEIAAEYVEKYDNVKLIHKENGGLSSARNAGLDVAQGEYVYFLDSDDYIIPETLEELYSKASANELDVIFFDAVPLFENEEIRKKNISYTNYYTRKKSYPDVYTGQDIFVQMRTNGDFRESVCLQFFRRDLLEKNHLRFLEGLTHEDLLFTFRCVMLAEKAGAVNAYYYYRRVHEDTIMTKPKAMRNVEGYIVSYAEALLFLRNITVQEDAAPIIHAYLYNSLYRNAYNMWYKLDAVERQKPLVHGDIIADQLLFTGRKALDLENHRNRLEKENEELENLKKRLKSENEELTKQLACYKKSRLCRIVLKCNRLAKKVKRIFRYVAEHGVKAAVRKGFHKVTRASARFMSKHTAGRVKKFFDCALKRGYRFALRACCVKLYQKIGGRAPLVSFILPVYNVEEYLPQCLDSLLQQTMPHIEIICVDDGSTDRSLEILKEYAAKDSRLQVLTQKNQYAGAARNLGLSKATGEYVVFLDSDDFFEKDLAKLAYYAAKANKADAVIFDGKRFNNATKQFNEKSYLFYNQYVPKKQPFSVKDCPDRIFQITTPAPWSKMFRRKFVLDTGLQFQTLQNSNDVFFTYSALAMAGRIVTVNRPLVYYRIGMSTNLQTTKQKNPLCFFDAYKALHDKLVELGLLDKVRQSYVNAAVNGFGYNLETIQNPDANQQAVNKLRNGGIEELELLGHDSSYYYNQMRYQQIMQIFDDNTDCPAK